ncbi:MAG: DNA-processing protein DprA [Clostridia bacterium]|nr:DNA-processing protein DprA [Clostridia bacterium]
MNYTDDEINLITLCSFDGLSDAQRRILLCNLTSSEPDFVKYEKSLIKSLSDGVYNKVKADFYDGAYRNKVLDGLESAGIQCVTYFSKNYPQLLKLIDTPPIVLYCKGNLSLLNAECFSVVGSRRTLPHILKLCKKTAKELASHFTVVSGIADGADAAAVEGALESGKVISVLAYGFNYFYPAKNKYLIEKVAKQGLLITEYPPETKPQKYLFPVRNRIIAGLSKGTLVVSAGKKSGALITAHYAKEYGRELFAFPYTVGVSSGEGCNFLLKNHATLAENTLDIFDYFGLDFKPQVFLELSDEEKILLDAIRELGEAFIPELAEKLKTQPYKLISAISKLEIKGLVTRIGGNRFVAV